jgi:hypothetical protein
MARKAVPGLPTVGRQKTATMRGRLQIKQAILPDVVLGNRSREVPVGFLPPPTEDALPRIDGILAAPALQARRVHFYFSEKTLSRE